KSNVWIDLSGWSPKYFPPQLVRYASSQLKDRVLFGSDFPLITPDRWLSDFEEAPFKDEVRPLILKENALRLLGLERSARRPSEAYRLRSCEAATLSVESRHGDESGETRHREHRLEARPRNRSNRPEIALWPGRDAPAGDLGRAVPAHVDRRL